MSDQSTAPAREEALTLGTDLLSLADAAPHEDMRLAMVRAAEWLQGYGRAHERDVDRKMARLCDAIDLIGRHADNPFLALFCAEILMSVDRKAALPFPSLEVSVQQ